MLFDFFVFYDRNRLLYPFKILRYFIFAFFVLFLLYWFDIVTINLCLASAGETLDPQQFGAIIEDIVVEEQSNQELQDTKTSTQKENESIFSVDIKKLEIIATAVVIVISCTAIVGGEIYARFFWKK